jgi:hypothetical protein
MEERGIAATTVLVVNDEAKSTITHATESSNSTSREQQVSKSNLEFKVLMELNAICLSLDRISNVLDDLITLTELPAAHPDDPIDNVGNTSEHVIGSRNNNHNYLHGTGTVATSSTNCHLGSNTSNNCGIVSIAHKQRLLIEELTRWKDVVNGDDAATEDKLSKMMNT